MKNLSAAILAKNEAENLKELLPTLGFAKEILVINDNSTDETVAVAKKYGAKIINHSLNSDFAAARQTALLHSKSDWVLLVDADERLTPQLITWLKQAEPKTEVSGYSFLRLDHFFGSVLKHGEIANARVIRLVNKKCGRFVRPVHEVWQSKLKIVKTNLVINHYPHQTINEFLRHINFYSSLNAKYWQAKKRKVSIAEIMFVPWLKFIYTYFFRLGFLDGAAGFVYSFMMSFHSFLSRAKLYQFTHQ